MAMKQIWTKKALLAGAAALSILTSGCATTGSSTSAPAIVNLMPDTRAYREAAEGRTEVDQASLFRTAVIEKHPEVYGSIVAAPSDTALARYVKQLSPLSASMDRLEPVLLAEISSGVERISVLTGDRSTAQPPIFLIPSFLSFDGQVRPPGDSSAVLFGLDTLAANHGSQAAPNLAPLVTHELFHSRHFAVNAPIRESAKGYFGPGGLPPLHGSVWFEGLATCASRLALPKAELADIMLGDQLTKVPDAEVRSLASELLVKLDSRAMEDVGRYLFKGGSRGAIPDRAGYLIGMLAADSVLKKMNLSQAMMLNGDALRAKMKLALEQLSSGSSNTNAQAACRA